METKRRHCLLFLGTPAGGSLGVYVAEESRGHVAKNGCFGVRGGNPRRKMVGKISRNFVCLSKKQNKTHIWPSGSAIQIEKKQMPFGRFQRRKLLFKKFQGGPAKKSAGPGVLGIGKKDILLPFRERRGQNFRKKKKHLSRRCLRSLREPPREAKKSPGNILQDQKLNAPETHWKTKKNK